MPVQRSAIPELRLSEQPACVRARATRASGLVSGSRSAPDVQVCPENGGLAPVLGSHGFAALDLHPAAPPDPNPIRKHRDEHGFCERPDARPSPLRSMASRPADTLWAVPASSALPRHPDVDHGAIHCLPRGHVDARRALAPR